MSSWLLFALLTVLSWGVYGILLHQGRSLMLGSEPANASLKAFLFVGVAYFVVAIVGPVVVLMQRETDWKFTPGGITWSFLAGVAGAVGAFTLILSLGAAAAIFKGAAPAQVMPIVFAGAPVVNTIVAMIMHPPEGGIKAIPVPFFIGIVLAAVGTFLVAYFSPSNRGPAAHKPAATTASAPSTPGH
ncbi:hypothetical protein [Roseimicrobium sp. ORNL1]|uniref:hypothetical protein n=1 Tax=Roseimicrobium sp. ORNL1 TaxID=2711231 RepID=UPI0013E13CD0|nr:hypothetical protein [Roseimicrobium sp. ORNL1]QIF02192.1 hypothetical protein G5S37_11845 [Roseimicrobium sp. ORNL1]